MRLPAFLNPATPRARLYLATALYGLAGGGVAVAFHYGIHALYHHTFAAWAGLPAAEFAWRTLALMLGTALAAGWIVNKNCPAAAGSGIPQLKLAYWKEAGWTSPRILLAKFVAGILSIGGGMSLGREGPSVQLSGALGSLTASGLGIPRSRHRLPAVAGAAAGLAAAFNTPLAAVTFVLEEIIGDLNSRLLGPVLMASVIGALVAHGLIGEEPAFHLFIPEEPGWAVFALTPLAAAGATFAGLLFQKYSIGLRGWTKRQKRVPGWLLPACAALLTWGTGFAVWHFTGHLGVFSLGYEDLSSALTGHLAWKIGALLLVTKLFVTVVCYGLGGCGGIFSPTLFFGGMAGLAAAGLGGLLTPLHTGDYAALAVVGMCACLGAVVRAPVTGILIVFEMTHQFSLILPLMLGALISQAISRRLMKSNFYEAILEQDGHHLSRIIPPRDLEAWQQMPISDIANYKAVVLTDTEPDTLRQIFDQHLYSGFPVMKDGVPAGVLTRAAMEQALLTGQAAKLAPLITARPEQSIREVQALMLGAGARLVVLADGRGRPTEPPGIVTVHDLLRAQLAYGDGREE